MESSASSAGSLERAIRLLRASKPFYTRASGKCPERRNPAHRARSREIAATRSCAMKKLAAGRSSGDRTDISKTYLRLVISGSGASWISVKRMPSGFRLRAKATKRDPGPPTRRTTRAHPATLTTDNSRLSSPFQDFSFQRFSLSDNTPAAKPRPPAPWAEAPARRAQRKVAPRRTPQRSKITIFTANRLPATPQASQDPLISRK